MIAAHGSARVADWRTAAASPGVLGRDRLHATGQLYALRASLRAEAVQGCLAGGGASGIPAPEDPKRARAAARAQAPRTAAGAAGEAARGGGVSYARLGPEPVLGAP